MTVFLFNRKIKIEKLLLTALLVGFVGVANAKTQHQ